MPGSSGSKNIYCSKSSYPYSMSVSWSESSPNVANNTSVISASGSMSGQNVSFAASSSYSYYLKLWWHDNRTGTGTLIASSASFNSLGMGYGSRSVSGSITVQHKSDGSLDGYVALEFLSPSTSGGWAPTTSVCETSTVKLTTIARTSSFTINAGSALLGSPVSIAIDRKSSAFTHRVSYQFAGSSSTTVTTSATTSASFTPPISLASRIPNSTTGALTISITTWNGSTQIGSAVNKSVNLGVPSSVVPTMGTPTATRIDNGVPSSWGVYVRSFSKCTVSIVSPAGAYGSTIKSYSITGGGLSSSSSSATTGVLNNPGTITFTCRITDSRGRSATKTVSINVLDYYSPSLYVSAERCDSSGAVSANGTYLRVLVNYDVDSVAGKNSVASKSVTCNGVTNTEFGDNAPFTLAANCSIGNSYILTASISDALGNSFSASVSIRTAARILNVNKNKTGIAIGKFSEKDAFEIGWPTEVSNTMRFLSGSRLVFQADTALDAGSAGVRLGPTEVFGNMDVTGGLTVDSLAKFNYNIQDRWGTMLNNGLTVYTSAGIDPNTTLEHLILTNHANRPSSTSAYWYIQTFFYSSKTVNSNRMQIAYPFSAQTNIYHRFWHNSTKAWSSWKKLVNDHDLTPQNVLWEGAWYMTGDQKVTSKGGTFTSQPNGIVLEFSGYNPSTQTVQESYYNTFFIPRTSIASHAGRGFSFYMAGAPNLDYIANKYLYIAANTIVGHNSNILNGTYSGVRLQNNWFVLRRVIGV